MGLLEALSLRTSVTRELPLLKDCQYVVDYQDVCGGKNDGKSNWSLTSRSTILFFA